MIGKTKKKILILGSEGQIGASLETHLKKKYIVTGIDILNHKSEDLRSKNSKIGLLIKNTDFVFEKVFNFALKSRELLKVFFSWKNVSASSVPFDTF